MNPSLTRFAPENQGMLWCSKAHLQACKARLALCKWCGLVQQSAFPCVPRAFAPIFPGCPPCLRVYLLSQPSLTPFAPENEGMLRRCKTLPAVDKALLARCSVQQIALR